jgi:hypothetical protein
MWNIYTNINSQDISDTINTKKMNAPMSTGNK